MSTYPKYSVTLTIYRVLNYYLFDADLSYHCPCCKGLAYRRWENLTPPSAQRILRKTQSDGRGWHVIQQGFVESYLRLRDDDLGCYSPEGHWLEYPVSQCEIEDAVMTAKKSKERKENLTLKLAQWFVTEYLGRGWTDADFRGSHMAHAKAQLSSHDMSDIVGCLTAIKLGMIDWPFPIEYLSTISKGEPPLITQWTTLKVTPPPIWNRHAYNQWARMVGHDELEEQTAPEIRPPAFPS